MFPGGVGKNWNFRRGEGYSLWAVFGKSRGEGGHMKNPFRGGGVMDIFWNHTFLNFM